ncbi:hypothetical protein TREMEDRAFT_62205 [Tremella mesenterica DSM 1558]|uniref:uncharacterized protein n=1 Tax=Tremella mesenterica (strain ATCC 24925 / CBS 8224 / DSM 1558 / NBRC 9311 / NRRL Y-6157 / RJB 2259-6 / UBC 559-6) TaxID=578456 RepID=UPI0003F496A2|nr:uncharacterized protein TREMEDRAFT_62205 [Tremella mesenterica DSM 1558]EIW69341.1 hypothetical protein TREMEDRAFT_62205 [Tremella mesenterica DSM 1558]
MDVELPADDDAVLTAMIDLMRRVSPRESVRVLDMLSELQPELADDLAGHFDIKLDSVKDEDGDYIQCDYNMVGTSYRSPWSNTYHPAIPDAPLPSPRLRELELVLNKAFKVYTQMYFGGGVCSVFLWDLEEEKPRDMGFAGAVVITSPPPPTDAVDMRWDSFHVFECHERGRSAKYKLTSTISVFLKATLAPVVVDKVTSENEGEANLCAHTARQAEYDYLLTTPQGHVANIGRMVEDME